MTKSDSRAIKLMEDRDGLEETISDLEARQRRANLSEITSGREDVAKAKSLLLAILYRIEEKMQS